MLLRTFPPLLATLLALLVGCSSPGTAPTASDAGASPLDGAPEAPPADPVEPPSFEKADHAGALRDVAGHKAEPEIRALVDLGFVAGFPDGTFRPDSAVTRAQFAAMVASAFLADAPASSPRCGAGACRDLPRSHWAHGAIGKASAAGFLRGYPDGTMGPDRTITRTEVAVALANGLGLSGGDARALEREFWDASSIPGWARPSIANALAHGMFSNDSLHGGWLRPTQTASRAVVASYLYYAQVLLVQCEGDFDRCYLEDPRNKAAVLVLGGVTLSYAAVVAVAGAAFTLGYIATYPDDFGAMLRALRSLSPSQLGSSILEARRRQRTGTCRCAVRNLPRDLQGRCPSFATGTGVTRHDCNNAARATVPRECRRYVGHCDFRY